MEDEAAAASRPSVRLADVQATRKRYLSSMAAEVKGYQLDTCFGPGGCPNRAMPADGLVDRLEQVLKDADLLAFLKTHVQGDLKFHHEFRVTVAECPNACSQPQIKDMGIIGAVPAGGHLRGLHSLSPVRGCVPDAAITLDPDGDRPTIDAHACMLCGKCITHAPREPLRKNGGPIAY